MKFFDTHAHLDDDAFAEILPEVVERAVTSGITRMICVGTTLAASQRCVEIAGQFEAVYAAVGIQPNYCSEADPEDWSQIVELSSAEKVVAIGETGLDKYWDHTPFELQESYFDRHLKLSAETGLPFIVHMRECGEEIYQMLKESAKHAPLRGVMHSFTGNIELAERCLNLGMYISFAGMVTYKKAADLREVAAAIPLNKLLIETDAPYLSPHPKRGVRPNEPALIMHTAECLAEVHGIPLKELAEMTTANAQALFQAVR